MIREELYITEETRGTRLDLVLSAGLEDYSRSFIQKLFEKGAVTVNGQVCTSKKYKCVEGDLVEIQIPDPEKLEAEAEDIPISVVYEDGDLLVVDKPAGMVVHPAPGNYSGTLVNALMYHCGDQLSSINGVIRPGIVHRIDKDTSGLLVVAKTDKAHTGLARQLEEHSINRIYRAIVYNNIKEDEGTVDAAIGRDSKNRLRNAVLREGMPGYESAKSAVTHYRVLERFGKYTCIEARLETGRTHQIRVHMAYIKHPLLGDELYGPNKNKEGAKRQMLHAGVLGFVHPVTGDYMEFESPLPEDFRKVLDRLREA
ncbi:MAG: RluA family pseudouridine synthase [Clostridia bacterium]|nr:RluA family pseudouridine synthase [Clostridia bacterium]